MLNGCGDQDEILDKSMHSQRGRRERGKNSNLFYIALFAIVYSLVLILMYYQFYKKIDFYDPDHMLINVARAITYGLPMIIASLTTIILFLLKLHRHPNKQERRYLVWSSFGVSIVMSLVLTGLTMRIGEFLFFLPLILFYALFLYPPYLLWLWLTYSFFSKVLLKVIQCFKMLTIANIKRMLWSSRRRKAISLFLLCCLIALPYQIKTVPNYSKKNGYMYVLNNGHEKYLRGYCLAEDRVLDEEEVLKKALKQYFEKSLLLEQKIYDYRANRYGSKYWKSPKGFYRLENIGVDDFYEVYDHNNVFELTKAITDEFRAKQVNPMNMVQIKGSMAYLKVPIVFHISSGFARRTRFIVFLKNFVLTKNDGYEFNYQYDFLSQGFEYGKGDKYRRIKVDNCGNLDFNVDKEYEAKKVHTAG